MKLEERDSCPYRGKRIEKFEPPLDVNGNVIHEIPVNTCSHTKRIDNDCVLNRGDVDHCGYWTDSIERRKLNENSYL